MPWKLCIVTHLDLLTFLRDLSDKLWNMCGIAGFVSIPPISGASGVLSRMTSLIAHRGPDGHGIYHDDHAYLGHRRLAIVDVASKFCVHRG